MYTSAELQWLRDVNPAAVIPGIDTPAGNPIATTALKSISVLPTTSNSLGIMYDAVNNRVIISKAGTVLSGYDFGNATVDINASNVTLKDCSFEATSGYFAVQIAGGYANATVTNCTFNGEGASLPLSAWISSTTTPVTVTNNQFLNTPGDGLHCFGGGVISGNYFSGAGYSSTGQHPDAIWITNSTNPMLVSDNFIDWTTNANSLSSTNDCIRITTEQGSVSNVTVSGNYLIGGTTSFDAGNGGTAGTYSNISIINNDYGFASCYGFYPGPGAGVTVAGNVDIDYTNPVYAANAWTAYLAAGLPTKNLLVSSGGSAISAGSGSTTLYGSASAHLNGGLSENNFVAGFGREYIQGGAGANIYTFLIPNGPQESGAPAVIANFDPAKDVIDLSNMDADLTTPGTQPFTFIGTSAFTAAGAQVNYQYNAASNLTYVEATLAGDTAPDFEVEISGAVTLTAANFALTGAQSSTDLANGAALSVSQVRSGNAAEYVYSNVANRGYTSYDSIYEGNYIVADDLNLSSTSNEIDLLAVTSTSSATITRGSQSESIATGTGSFKLAYQPNETINAGNAGSETFSFNSGFGNETINGLALSGSKADNLVLSTAAFSYLNAGMSQTQDLAAVLSYATQGSSATITDSKGDSLTLTSVSAAMLAANPNAVRFV